MNILIFHRDFRIEDNSGLIALAKEEKNIYLLFIFTDIQTKNNPYYSDKSFQAMIYCLKQLSNKIHINFLTGFDEVSVIKQLIKANHKINKIYTNKDYTPFAINRSKQIQSLASEENFIYREFSDYLLFDIDQVQKNDHPPFYQVFTPYWNRVKVKPFPSVDTNIVKFNPMKLNNTINISYFQYNDFNLPLTREKVKQAIFNLPSNYKILRDMLDQNNATSHLSCAIKFGIVSIRQIHLWTIKRFKIIDNDFTRQLIWKDFFYQAVYNGQIYKQWKFGQNWNRKMNNMKWVNNEQLFEKWKNGQTGVDIVDSAMNELNNYGTMHNRCRLITASYLVKNLNIDWKKGEQYFAQKLIDYDPIVNHCSWQWVAGTGFDAQPFIRIFNPYIQEKKFDPNRIYINKYLKRNCPIEPIVDYATSVKEAKARYMNLK